MFTGIVEGMGIVKGISPTQEGLLLGCVPDFLLTSGKVGESIAVNGVCLTAVTISERFFTADVSFETLERTNLGALRSGSRVNLERAMRPVDRLGGHIVTGHIDCVGEIVEMGMKGRFLVITIAMPEKYADKYDHYLVEKGSVAVDGVSLTVNACGKGRFSLAIIPHTARLTTIGFKQKGDLVNVELDILAKYVEKMLNGRLPQAASSERGKSSIDASLLMRHGFL
ncbi:MAG: riboflavin synthase [Deltaproteobacteria bacterium]|jgi:riboflavin synthase|nr:riboflavin synthase [Deltaproteobacteria bacterium]